MIKYTSPELSGYGFDLEADRVVRYNKHPDGTYLNTRATYSINRRQFTHYALRSQALKEKTGEKKKRVKWGVIALFVIIVALLSNCSVEVSVNVNPTTTEGN